MIVFVISYLSLQSLGNVKSYFRLSKNRTCRIDIGFLSLPNCRSVRSSTCVAFLEPLKGRENCDEYLFCSTEIQL